MTVLLTIKNYRCFVSPTTIDLAKGFTAFVGVNNAGKSTIMRFLLEMRPLLTSIANLGQNSLLYSLIHPIAAPGWAPLHVIDPQEIFSNLNRNALEFWFDFEVGNTPGPATLKKVHFTVERNLQWRTDIHTAVGLVQTRGVGPLQFANNNLVGTAILADFAPLFQIIDTLSKTLYIGPFRNTINVGTKIDYLDIQIGEAFIKQFRALKTGPLKAHSTGIQNLTNDIQKIFEYDSLDIIPSADDSSLHITVNSKPYKQHELGSGLAQFIVVLANAAIKRPKLILIDEPELNLHPRLQLDFMTTLGSYAEHGIWFSTHSVGLARASAERVYSVIRQRDGDSIIRPLAGVPRLAEFLGEMSFSSHKELGFEKLLLVEGPTEVKVIQQFLRLMGKDHKFVLLPMHGHLPQLEELEEILRITPDVASMIDSERPSAGAALEKKRQEFLELCKSKDIRAIALERRATENYFPDAIVKKIFGEGYRGLGPYERLDDTQPHWSKSQNWKLAAAMSLNELKETDMGGFLDDL